MNSTIQTIKGSINLILMILNTMFWVPPLYVITLIKLIIPIQKFQMQCTKVLLKISESWIAINAFILKVSHNVNWEIQGLNGLTKLKSYLIVANHQSWTDIVVLQTVFNHKIPFPRFFVKRQLKWLPLLGGAFWALDFPFMNRFPKDYLKKYPKKAGDDIRATQIACRKISRSSFSLINFPEGTRFSIEKNKSQNSPFKNQLSPKAGGIAYALEAFEGKLHDLLDVTIIYPSGKLSFWGLLSGQIPDIIVKVRQLKIPEEFGIENYALNSKYRKQVQTWINEIWAQKDAEIESTLQLNGQSV